jgi:LacI family transcriptional regulator
MRQPKRIALIYDARLAYDLKVMRGVATYLQERGDYSVYIEENALRDQRLPDLRSWKGDGIIADFDDPTIARAVVHSKLPVVGFGGGYGWYLPKLRIPYFYPNNEAVSHLAAAHLLARGLRHFAYCGYAQTPINGWSKEREKSFAESINKAGYSCDVYRGRHKTTRQWSSVQNALGKWLESLQKPLGVMAANDIRARQVLETCRAFKLRVPEEVAVVGVDNDELLCQLSSPLLTSIEQGAKRIGYEAAALLDKMMRGKSVSELHFVTEPVGIVTRKSTDVFAIEDPKVAQAMAFISEHAFDGIKVRDVVSAVAISPSGLEHRFKSALGYTIRASIRRVQLERARQLITSTALPLKQVAANTGFKSVQHLTTLFGKAFGHPPGGFRKLVV